ncbi:Electron transfer flavoprotein beta-subunit [Granulibacter bethesdensis]|uniref:Electron transfer flavoprotein beta-subunit n=1 Tax=Granulibacter bethesdensis TaxID=364410 RepID=A0AAC9K8E8_9PROT|nr:electron transfer flavoprotein subunit beta [Granulibacter bethesdensis]APH53294.1 Electron transfer flavoprotein beta-subunit [Granulibacter bethesdensis]APH60869.1 Electron transfer flavoprotein beta-subunit [Granulibacter bethesdensis]
MTQSDISNTNRLNVLVLLSAGCHPVSGRAAPVMEETQAIALAHQLGAHVSGLHAGPEATPLRDVPGHGLNRIVMLRQDADIDPLPALLAFIRRNPPDLILTGRRAQGGMDSGTLPYRLAQALGWPIAADIAAIDRDTAAGTTLHLLQARPKGARRAVSIQLPCVLTVHPAAPRPLPFAFAAMRKGVIETIEASTLLPEHEGMVKAPSSDIEERPYRARPRLIAKAGAQGNGQLMVHPSAEDAARAVITYLREIGVLQAPSSNSDATPHEPAGS